MKRFSARYSRGVLGAVVLVWAVCCAHAQPIDVVTDVVADSVADGGVERHGWAVLPMGEGFALVHLPPRAEVTTGEGFSARADDGEMVLAKELRERPERVVGSGRSAFLVFAPKEGRDGVLMRTVLSVTARLAPMGGRWVTDSAKRLRARGAIPGAESIVDAVGFRFEGRSDDGCAVLLGEAVGEEGRSALDLRVLDSGAWMSVSMPTGLTATDQARLVASERGLLLVARAGDGSGWVGWRGAVKPGVTEMVESAVAGEEVVPARSAPTVVWSALGAMAGLRMADEAVAWEIGGRVVTSGVEMVGLAGTGSVGRWVVREGRDGRDGGGGGMVELVTREVGSSMLAQVAAGVGTGTRIILLYDTESEAETGGAEGAEPDAEDGAEDGAQKVRSGLSGLVSRVGLVEVSAATGRVLYEGLPEVLPLVSMTEVGLLILVAVGAGMGVLVFVLLPEPKEDAVGLPVGTALAEPFRRFAAGSADVAGAMIVASWVIGMAADSGAVERSAGDLWTFALTVAIAFVHGTLGEWAFGLTVGKMLLGCRVASSRRGGSWGVGLRQALVRNVVKFAMPPVAMFGLSDADGRHRGDVLAGTVVVIRVEHERDGGGVATDRPGGHDAGDDQSAGEVDGGGGGGGGDGGDAGDGGGGDGEGG